MANNFGHHGGNLRQAAERYNLPAEQIIDFSASINPLGPPKKVKEILGSRLDAILHYPDPECKRLKMKLAEHLQINRENLLFGNGSAELIYLICRALLPKKVLIPIPTFSEYENAVRSVRGKCVFLKTREREDFRIPLRDCSKWLPEVDLIFLCNPNNPTGSLLDKDHILSLLKECRRQVLVIDEAFIDFVEEGERVSVIKEASTKGNLLVLRSLTKFFALPGLRVGYVIGHTRLMARLSRAHVPWSVNSLAQLMGAEIISDAAYARRSKKYMLEQRRILFETLSQLKSLRPYPPTANFIFCKLTDRRFNSIQLYDALAKRGILIRDCSNFRGMTDRYIRVAVRGREENRLLIQALKNVLET